MNSHLSEEQISRCIAGDRSTADEWHLSGCVQCAGEVRKGQEALLLFRESAYRCAEYWQGHPRATGRFAWTRIVTFAAAMAVLALGLFSWPKKAANAQPERQVFVQIPYVVPPAPFERTKIVRMDVPVAALIAAGLRVSVVGAAEHVRADVLVAQDGRPLAVSLISKGRNE